MGEVQGKLTVFFEEPFWVVRSLLIIMIREGLLWVKYEVN